MLRNPIVNDPSLSSVEFADEPARRKWPIVVFVLVLLLVCMLAGSYISFRNVGRSELQAAIAEVERHEPRWRLDDVEIDRAVVPEERNSARTAMGVKALLPPKWPAWEQHPSPAENNEAEAKRAALEESFQELQPPRQLSAEQIEALRAELTRAEAALVQARKLSELTEGRYPIHYSADAISTLLPYAQNTREIARLLSYDVLLRAQENDAEQALRSCRAIINAGRSVGDEPTLVSQLVRIAIRSIAVDKVQRALAQGQPSEAALRKLQQLLEKEEPEPLLLIGMRGERGGMDRLLLALESGTTSLDSVLGGPSGMESLTLRLPGSMDRQRAAMLRYLTRAVEVAKLPPGQQQHDEMQQLEAIVKTQPYLVRLLAPAFTKVFTAFERSRMELRCAVAALAAERYRHDKKRWPDTLEALCEAGYLGQVPVDLYDGKPVRLRRLDDGLLIYSIGPDGEDNGGNLDPKKPLAKGTDLGFRLWDADKRRQPPAPKPRPPDADMPPGLILPP
jgi:hypothetical protein